MYLYQFGGARNGKKGGAIRVGLEPGLEVSEGPDGFMVRRDKESLRRIDETLGEFARDRDVAKKEASKVRGVNEELRLDNEELRNALDMQKNAWWNGLFWGAMAAGTSFLAWAWIAGWMR